MRKLFSLLVVASAFCVVSAEEPKKAETKKETKKDEAKKGTVTGVVTKTDDKGIEVLVDGEEKARRFTPHWRGGLPANGGGLDKDMMAKIKATPVKARVRIEWEFEERARVIKLEVLNAPKEEPKK